jgi:hypothetical protein
VEDGVVGEERGVGGDAVVEGQPRADVLGAQAADAADVLLQRMSDKYGCPENVEHLLP